MTRLSFWRYELANRRGSGLPREGALLRVSSDEKPAGYGDVHPWPELGDAQLETHLRSIGQRSPTRLVKVALVCATVDREARNKHRSLFGRGLVIPPSHVSIHGALNCEPEVARDDLERASERGFDRIKLKAGYRLDSELQSLAILASSARDFGLKVRIDFNARATVAEVASALEGLRATCGGLEWIDWIEDPCPFSIEDWKRLREDFQIRLAADRDHPDDVELKNAVDVMVHKPAVEGLPLSSFQTFAGLPVCVTSYLDHPVGQLFAALKAALLSRKARVETCGLLTHEIYEPNAFSERLKTDGPVLIPPEGTGIGFDDLLENLPWEDLA